MSFRPVFPALLAAAAITAATLPATAQTRSVLSLLPTEDRRLTIGSEASGALSASDFVSTYDAYLEAWELEGRAGNTVTIDLVSDDFDAMLYLTGPGLADTMSDDDGGDGCNARLSFTFLESGTFHVVATTLNSRTTGTYRIRVSEDAGSEPRYGCGEADPTALMALPVEGRSLSMGSVESGRMHAFSATLSEGQPAEAWLLQGQAGERVTIVMESTDFDAYLYLTGPGLDAVLSDDDGAGDLNAQIDVTLPASGPYVVAASALSDGMEGAYTLRVTEPLDLGTVETYGRTLTVGAETAGEIDFSDPMLLDGRRGQAWALDLTAGQRVTVELLSDDFDAYLYVAGPGIAEPLSDDDGAGDLDSRIAFTASETGSYRVIASSLSGGEGGFTLRVSER